LSLLADETRDLRCIFHDVPRIVVQLHPDKDISGEKLSFRGFFFTRHKFDNVLFRNQDVREKRLASLPFRSFPAGTVSPGSQNPEYVCTTYHLKAIGLSQYKFDDLHEAEIDDARKVDTMITTMMTTDVEARVCLGVGHVTFFSSTFDPVRNCLIFSVTILSYPSGNP